MKQKFKQTEIGMIPEDWEIIHNPHFNRVGFDTVRTNAGLNSFTISPSKWIEETNCPRVEMLTDYGRII